MNRVKSRLEASPRLTPASAVSLVAGCLLLSATEPAEGGRQDTIVGSALAIGAGLGITVGVLVGGGAAIAIGAGIGAGISVAVGAAWDASHPAG